jgi:ATP-dependent exoDNAse (exonuclease V) beta subunit
VSIKDNFQDIEFEPEEHIYTRNQKEYISVTTLIDGYIPEFDSETISRKVARKKGVSQSKILAQWEHIKDVACALGTEFHLYVETYLNNGEIIQTETGIEDRTTKFHKFWEEFSKTYEVIANELIVFDDESEVAGTIDCLVRNKKTGAYRIVDWKTNKEIKTSNSWQNMHRPFSHLDDCNFNHYSLQLSVYREILKRSVMDVKLEENTIVYFPEYKDYEIIITKDLSKQAQQILKRE